MSELDSRGQNDRGAQRLDEITSCGAVPSPTQSPEAAIQRCVITTSARCTDRPHQLTGRGGRMRSPATTVGREAAQVMTPTPGDAWLPGVGVVDPSD